MTNEIKEILDIFKKINEEYSLDTDLDFEDYEIPNVYLKALLEYITNLQEENQALRNQLDFIEEQNHIIDKLEKENKLLKEQMVNMTQPNYKMGMRCNGYELGGDE